VADSRPAGSVSPSTATQAAGPTPEERRHEAARLLEANDRDFMASKGQPVAARAEILVRVEQAFEAAKAVGHLDVARFASKGFQQAFALSRRLGVLETQERQNVADDSVPGPPKLILPEAPMTKQEAIELAQDTEDRQLAREAYRESRIEHGRAVADATQAHQEAMKAYQLDLAERATAKKEAEKARLERKQQLGAVRKGLTDALATLDAGILDGGTVVAPSSIDERPVATLPVSGGAGPLPKAPDRGACLRSCVATCGDDAACERSCATTKCR